MIDIQEEVIKNVAEFAKEFNQVFWMRSAFCLKRNEIHKEKCCNSCESRMTCAIANRLLHNVVTIVELEQRVALMGLLISKQEELVFALRHELHKATVNNAE